MYCVAVQDKIGLEHSGWMGLDVKDHMMEKMMSYTS